MWVVELKPFRKLRYKLARIEDISRVVTLPYDVITPEKQDEYYRLSPYNLVRLILARDEPGDGEDGKYERVRRQLDSWMRDGILVEDELEALYIYEEDYPFEGRRHRRAGIVGLVKLEPFEKGVILPHENVLEKPLKDRFKLLKATRTHLEMIIGLFPDRGGTAASVMGRYMKGKPQLDFVHGDDIRHRVWKITDRGDIEALGGNLKGNNVIIADGHHRYTTALRHMQETKKPGDGYIMMLLWPMDDDLRVLPTHRVLRNIPDKGDMAARLGGAFDVKGVKGGLDELLGALAKSVKGSFGMYDGQYRLLVLKDRKLLDEVRDAGKTDAWNSLDVNILQNLLITRVLGVDYRAAADNGDLAFVKDALKAVKKVYTGEYEAAFFLKPTTIEEIHATAKAGERMPQKSTYFYPKPLSGVLMCRL